MIYTKLTLAIQMVDRLLSYCIFTQLTEKLPLIISKDTLVPCKGLHSIRAMLSGHRSDALRPPAEFRWGPPPRHHHPAQTAHRSAKLYMPTYYHFFILHEVLELQIIYHNNRVAACGQPLAFGSVLLGLVDFDFVREYFWDELG